MRPFLNTESSCIALSSVTLIKANTKLKSNPYADYVTSHSQNKTDTKKRETPGACTKKLLRVHIKWFPVFVVSFSRLWTEKLFYYTTWKQVWAVYSSVLVTSPNGKQQSMYLHFASYWFLKVNWDILCIPPPPPPQLWGGEMLRGAGEGRHALHFTHRHTGFYFLLPQDQQLPQLLCFFS